MIFGILIISIIIFSALIVFLLTDRNDVMLLSFLILMIILLTLYVIFEVIFL